MVSAVLGRRHLEMSETRHAATIALGPRCLKQLPSVVNASLGASLDASLGASGVQSRRP